MVQRPGPLGEDIRLSKKSSRTYCWFSLLSLLLLLVFPLLVGLCCSLFFVVSTKYLFFSPGKYLVGICWSSSYSCGLWRRLLLRGSPGWWKSKKFLSIVMNGNVDWGLMLILINYSKMIWCSALVTKIMIRSIWTSEYKSCFDWSVLHIRPW